MFSSETKTSKSKHEQFESADDREVKRTTRQKAMNEVKFDIKI